MELAMEEEKISGRTNSITQERMESGRAGDAPPAYREYDVGWLGRRYPLIALATFGGSVWAFILLVMYPMPTTIPVFIVLAFVLTAWVASTWLRLITTLICPRDNQTAQASRFSKICLLVGTTLVVYWVHLGWRVPPEEVPILRRTQVDVAERYFIAANLYNNEDILPVWTDQVLKFSQHVGTENVYISIYESNSADSTPALLQTFANTLSNHSIAHRVITDRDDNRWWPYETSPERIDYLAQARNRALEPLQSTDSAIRLDDYHQFTKIVFLNDVLFTWQSVVRLLATRLDGRTDLAGDYDLACGFDYTIHGLYDTWAARDICGTPLRLFWPFVKDRESIERLKRNQPIEVASCWNGVAVFQADLYRYRPPFSGIKVQSQPKGIKKRGWKMVDDPSYPHSKVSPPVKLPLKFRASEIEACDHSECFLASYDLHRIYSDPDRPPRIYMNPSVKVAYERRWYEWNNIVLERPIFKWWTTVWSRGWPNMAVDWLQELLSRRRDYCTWAGLNLARSQESGRCPALSGAISRSWDQ